LRLKFQARVSDNVFARDFSHECVDSPFSESFFANRIVIMQNFLTI